MRKFLSAVALSLIAVMTQAQSTTSNPLLGEFNTPHGTVPFDLISVDDYEPAVREGIRLGLQQVEAIFKNR